MVRAGAGPGVLGCVAGFCGDCGLEFEGLLMSCETMLVIASKIVLGVMLPLFAPELLLVVGLEPELEPDDPDPDPDDPVPDEPDPGLAPLLV